METEFTLDLTVVLRGIIWIVQHGGAGVVVYFIIDKLLKPQPWFQKLSSEQVRWVAIGGASLVACLAFLFGIVMGYFVKPADPRVWVESLASVSFASVVSSQLLHGAKKLRN